MGLFENFPYTNFHRLNLDWLIKKVRALEEKVTALEQEVALIKARLTSLENRMAEAEAEIDALKLRMGAAEQEINSLKDRVSDLEARAAQLENRMTAAEQNITALDQRMSAAEQSITALGQRLTAAENAITSLQDRMDSAEESITAMQLKTMPVDISDTVTGVQVTFQKRNVFRFGNVVAGQLVFSVQPGSDAPSIDLPFSAHAGAMGYKSISGGAQGSYLEPSILISGSYHASTPPTSRFNLNSNFFPEGDICGLFFCYIIPDNAIAQT